MNQPPADEWRERLDIAIKLHTRRRDFRRRVRDELSAARIAGKAHRHRLREASAARSTKQEGTT